MIDLDIILKVTHGCNLNCKYCYDAEQRDRYGKYVMPITLFEEIVNKLDANTTVRLTFHGGEPTTVSVDWYKKAFEICNNRTDINFEYSMQSNGHDVSDEMLDLFWKNRVWMGVSYDMGSQLTQRGTSVHAQQKGVLHTMQRFLDNNRHIGAISVITNNNRDKLIDMFKLARDKYDYTPAFNFIFPTLESEKNGLSIDISLLKKNWKDFVEFQFTDSHYSNEFLERGVSSQLRMISGEHGGVCIYRKCIGTWLSITPNGSVHICDEPITVLGETPKVWDLDNITDFFNTEYYSTYKIVLKKIRTLCKNCWLSNICQGGCPIRHLGGVQNLNDVSLSTPSCDMLKMLMTVVFTELQKFDVYSNDAGSSVALKKVFTERLAFTPMEVYKSLEIIDKDFEYNPNVFNLQMYELVIGLNKMIKQSHLEDNPRNMSKCFREEFLIEKLKEYYEKYKR